MAGARIIFPDFREEQSDSRYPFADTANLTSTDGLEIPRNAFIDATLYTINGSNRAYISAISVDSAEVVLLIRTGNNSAPATARYNPLTPPASGHVPVYDNNNRPAGLFILTADSLALFGGWPTGLHTFSANSTEFVSSVVIPAQESCVRALTNNADQFFTGDVWIIGDRGVVVRKEGEDTIRVDIVGEPLFKRLLCGTEETPFEPEPQLQTINGCGPDEYGNFNITLLRKSVNDPVLRVYVKDDAIQIETVGNKVL